jgi:hypothetical protein
VYFLLKIVSLFAQQPKRGNAGDKIVAEFVAGPIRGVAECATTTDTL